MPLIIPLFIPQEGCPHTCVFCNQHHISQKNKFLGPQEVQEEIKHWLALVHKSTDKHVQVAFYGGAPSPDFHSHAKANSCKPCNLSWRKTL